MRLACLFGLVACSYPHPTHLGDDDGGVGSDAHGDGQSQGGVNLTTSINGRQSPLGFVAGQIDDGAWTVLTSTDGTYHLDATGRYGFVYTCVNNAPSPSVNTTFIYATTADTPAPTAGCQTNATGTSELDVAIQNLPAADSAFVTCSTYGMSIAPNNPTAKLTGLSSGTHDCIVVAPYGTARPQSIMIKRGVTVPGNTAIDFNTGIAPTSPSYSISGVSAPFSLNLSETFQTSDPAYATIVGLSGSSGTYVGLPLTALAAGDLFTLQAFQVMSGSEHFVAKWVHDPTTLALAMPGDVGAATAGTAATQPYLRPHVTINIDLTPATYGFNYTDQASTYRETSVSATTGWIGAATTFDFTLPDLSALAGWDNTWVPASTPNGLTVLRIQTNGTSGTDGFSVASSSKNLTVTP